MDPLGNPLDGFSPELYIATLSELAHSDGLHPKEKDLLDHQAERFDIDLAALADLPEGLTELPWATRVPIYRDAVMLALADEHVSIEEREYLSDLAERMKIPAPTADSISVWAEDYGALPEQLEALIGEQV